MTEKMQKINKEIPFSKQKKKNYFQKSKINGKLPIRISN